MYILILKNNHNECSLHSMASEHYNKAMPWGIKKERKSKLLFTILMCHKMSAM